MKLFECQYCRSPVYFDNTVCVNCGYPLGYLPERFEVSALEADDGRWKALSVPELSFKSCANAQYDACNWLLPADSDTTLCAACSHNLTVPDLSLPENLANWRKIELAKRPLTRPAAAYATALRISSLMTLIPSADTGRCRRCCAP